MIKANRYSPEVRKRAVGMVFDHEKEHSSRYATLVSIASQIGCTPETLRRWVQRVVAEQRYRSGTTTEEQERKLK